MKLSNNESQSYYTNYQDMVDGLDKDYGSCIGTVDRQFHEKKHNMTFQQLKTAEETLKDYYSKYVFYSNNIDKELDVYMNYLQNAVESVYNTQVSLYRNKQYRETEYKEKQKAIQEAKKCLENVYSILNI
jgi:hypothetical protein